jgi:hypothetical protein
MFKLLNFVARANLLNTRHSFMLGHEESPDDMIIHISTYDIMTLGLL